jgi:hypothetical protein
LKIIFKQHGYFFRIFVITASFSRAFIVPNIFRFNHISSICFAAKAYKQVLEDLQLPNAKPTVNGEPCYEDHPVDWKPNENGWFNDFDVTQSTYQSVLAGSLGHTFGNHNIWQFFSKLNSPISYARTPWQQAIDYPAATQMTYLKTFFETYAWYKLQPSQDVVVNNTTHFISTSKAKDNSFLIVYIPNGGTVTINTSQFNSTVAKAYWFNPRMGNYIKIGLLSNTKEQVFKPPFDKERGNDWVLLITKKQILCK